MLHIQNISIILTLPLPPPKGKYRSSIQQQRNIIWNTTTETTFAQPQSDDKLVHHRCVCLGNGKGEAQRVQQISP